MIATHARASATYTDIYSHRLRTIEWPADIIDAIGRWSTEGVGKRCALGFDLKLKSKWKKINVKLTKQRG